MISAASSIKPLAHLQIEVLDQACALIDACKLHQKLDFAKVIGPHLRHIIEHYEALTGSIATAPVGQTPVVDYDARQRDRLVERDTQVAQQRLQSIKKTLLLLPADVLNMAVEVHLLGGVQGQQNLRTYSSIGRELMFVASHAVHHFAIIKLHVAQSGVQLDVNFGKAPATIANEQRPQPAMENRLLPWQTKPDDSTIQLAITWQTRCRIRMQRLVRWEFWPAWLFYLPILAWVAVLAIRYRGLTKFTAINPLLESGGFVGERKHVPLGLLQKNAPKLAATFELIATGTCMQRRVTALAFAQRHGFPVVLKPDVGQRGRGVFIARNAEQLAQYLTNFSAPVIVQRYIAGAEFGVFICRPELNAPLQILSIVHKTFPEVTGDGVQTLRQLILNDARAQLIAKILLTSWADQLDNVPAYGEVVRLVEIGAHCRGSVFLDGGYLETSALRASLTRLLDAVPGYQFGRIDLRAPDLDSFQRGIDLQVMELNGVAAESAHIYQPGSSLIAAYRAMLKQWTLAFKIGARNAQQGTPFTPTLELIRHVIDDFSSDKSWF